MSGHAAEMPRTPGEWLVQHLVDELGVDEADAVLVWFELGDYVRRVARMLDEDPENVAVKMDAGFGEFVFLDPE